MAKKFWTGDLVPSGESPLGTVFENANGTVVNGKGDDGINWNAPQGSTISDGYNSVQPPPSPVVEGFVTVVSHVRKRRGD